MRGHAGGDAVSRIRLVLLVCFFLLAATGILALLRGREEPEGASTEAWGFEPLTLPEGELEDLKAQRDLLLAAMRVTSLAGPSEAVGHAYRSVDGGRSWEVLEVDTSPCQWFALSPGFEQDGPVVLVSAGRDVYLSQDRGDSWERISAVLNPRAIGVSAGEPLTVYVATYRLGNHHQLYKWERNRGWEVVLDDTSLGTYGGFLQVLAFSRKEVLLLVSHDSGGDWHTELWRTEDGWRSWSRSLGFPVDANGDITDAGNRGLLVGTAGGELYQSLDDGATWHPFAQSPGQQVEGISGSGDLLVATVERNGGTCLLRLTESGWAVLSDEPGIPGGAMPCAVSSDEIYVFARPRFLARVVGRR